MHHQWKIRRHLTEAPDALHRWDRAYQLLLCLGTNDVQAPVDDCDVVVQLQEGHDEPCDVCAGIHPAPSTNADH